MAESIPELYFDEVESGATGTSPKVTVTSEMIMTYADLTGDHTPVHTDEEFARKSSFGKRVAHGLLGLSLTDGLKTQADLRFVPGMSLGWEWDFKLPIAIGDELHCRFTVESKRETSKGGWGIMRLASELVNQRGEVVQTGVHKLMIPMKSTAAA
ncbi:MaoC family dehydratase [Sulfitobacter sp. G21635-S1]|uniref:MaoC family dehydratase n=1 Tax=Sulfitobacter sp. G21635-S1 TaxID=3014043 RepID=UPI0022AEA12E|nr:MaoC family dehydratase [Sulfitobacter sp. G21635-S1]MCZ4255548.1 MaoC family dehydratase [Sulfitobacter sp. G21635-S1]